MYRNLLIHSRAGENLGSFHFGVIMNKVAININVEVLGMIFMLSFHLDKYRYQIPKSCCQFMFNFIGNS